MAELVLIKAVVGSRVATVLCPTCGRISRQILSKSYSESIKADLLREYECSLCSSVYHKCDSTMANRFLTDEEKQLYAARSGCSYDVFEELASERLMHLEIMSWRQKSRRREQENKELRLFLQELEKKGKAITKDGKCYIVPSENTVFYV